MNCEICGEYGYVTHNRDPTVQDGVTYRLRRCKQGHMFWTQETVLLTKGDDPALTTDDMVTLLRNERG